MGGIRAVAFDLDGTLAEGDRIDPGTVEAVAQARRDGIATILVTGRTGPHLDAGFPQLREVFDAVVTENGGVLEIDGTTDLLAGAVDDELVRRLEERGVTHGTGLAILDCAADDIATITDVIGEGGFDAQLVRNRGRVMVVPPGISKGTGLRAAAHQLGLSEHNVLAVGDAENDIALLDAAEVGVAVSNAIPSLKRHADLVLDEADGVGVRRLLAGPVLSGVSRVLADRHRVVLGRSADGVSVTVPGSQANILVRGPSGSGKSYLAGLLIEQWVRRGYTVLVLDVEGDYVGLSHLPEVVVIDGGTSLTGGELAMLLRQRSTSVVVDLSTVSEEKRGEVVRGLAPVVEAERAAWGMPHWVVLDEAHAMLGSDGLFEGGARPGDRGYLLVTYQPSHLRSEVLQQMDATITTGEAGPDLESRTATVAGAGGEPPRRFTPARRMTPHVRHWHKYTTAPLPPDRWFTFTSPEGEVVAEAVNVASFVLHLQTVDSAVLARHLERGDFSRWLLSSLQDQQLGAVAGAIERDLLAAQALSLQRARERLVRAIEDHYGPRPAGT